MHVSSACGLFLCCSISFALRELVYGEVVVITSYTPLPSSMYIKYKEYWVYDQQLATYIAE